MKQSPRRFGTYEVLRLKDGVFEAGPEVLIHASGEAARERLRAEWGEARIRIDVNAFLLRDASGVTLVDAGTGPEWGPNFGHLRQELAALGIARGDVRRVILTHIHGDHALGLFDGEERYFPEAEILVPMADLAFFLDPRQRERLPKARQGAFDIAERLKRLYGARLVPIMEGIILPGIEAVALPGHTPGHTGYLLRDAAGGLLLWADALHLEEHQARDPNVGLAFDIDPEVAALTRRSILERAARQGWIVCGGHLPDFRWVRAEGQGFRLLPA
ncbi:AidB family quorum-quenching N-acyl homoserine lactonase [Aureimonas endophytica]|uniref:AidB family quorum-quenching N-acyl homoserine lactonase n=1 Tax=Aureimonas endophytica TaxID=2027858 RepID=UPI001667A422|nr:MBL fold metallo-hydrolase [Aureimonas endophytica]